MRSVASHELGHVADFGDIDSASAIMNIYPSRKQIDYPRADDINGIWAIYGS